MGGVVNKIGRSIGSYLGVMESAADKQDRESAQAALEKQLADAQTRQNAMEAEIAARTAQQQAAFADRAKRLQRGRIGLLGFGETGFTGLLGG